MDRRDAIKRTMALTGMVITIPVTSSILGSCQPKGGPDWTPNILSSDQAIALEEITEIVLPSSVDSPGAKEIHLAEFIDLIINDCFDQSDQEEFKSGLDSMLSEFEIQSGRSFSDTDDDSRIAFISTIDQEAYSGGTNAGEFYRTLKQLALLGYFTSEKVMTTQLDYHAIPGRYDACIPYTGQRAYVDNNVSG